MSIDDIIGYLISFAAILYIFGRYLFQSKKQSKRPEEDQEIKEEREKRLRKLLKSYDLDVVDEEEPGPVEIKRPKKKRPHGAVSKQAMERPTRPLVSPPLVKSMSGPPVMTAAVSSPYYIQDQRKDYIQDQRNAYRITRQGPIISRGRRILGQVRSPKDMIVIREIIGPPKSMER